jgi:hypothetical protein
MKKEECDVRLRFVMFFCLALLLIFPLKTECYAKTEAEKAIEAYREILEADEYQWTETSSCSTELLEFCLFDLNKDGIKELFLRCIQHPGGLCEGDYRVITYSDGETKCVLKTNYMVVYKKANIIEVGSVNCGIDRTYYYSITEEGELSQELSYVKQNAPLLEGLKHIEVSENGTEWYYKSCKVGEKEVSWKKYAKARKKLLGKAKRKELSFKYNVVENRIKYLK